MTAGKKVWLTIVGTQYPPEDETRDLTEKERNDAAVVTRMQAEAEYRRRGDSHYLFYEEQMEGFPEPVKSRMKYREGLLEMTRQGGIESRMVFEPGRNYRTEYPTPYGRLFLDVVTEHVTLNRAEADGAERPGPAVTVDYALENESRQIGVYRLEITISDYLTGFAPPFS